MEKIIKKIDLPSGGTAMAFEASQGTLALEVGSGCIFLSADDIPALVRLMQDADKYFLSR